MDLNKRIILHETMQNSKNKEHIYYFDLLRIGALFLVVMLHVAGGALLSGGGSWRYGWGIANAFDSLCRCAVPLYVMISGALFLGRDLSIKQLFTTYVVRIVRTFIIWSVFYGIVGLLDRIGRHEPFSTWIFVCDCLAGHYHLWFLFMIAGLYLIVPFLRKIAQNNHLLSLFLVMGFVSAILIPQSLALVALFSPAWGTLLTEIVGKMHVHFFLGYSEYFMFGYWLHKRHLSDNFVCSCGVLGILGIVVTCLLVAFETKSRGGFYGTYYAESNLNVFFPAAAVFVICKRILTKLKGDSRFGHFIAGLAQYSFGAYLIHAFIFERLGKDFHLWGLAFHPLGAIPVTSLVTFVLSLGAAILLSQFPFLKKWCM